MSNHIVVDATEARLVRKLVESGGYTPDDALAAVRNGAQSTQEAPGRDEGAQAEESPTPDDTTPQRASKSLTVTIPAAPAKELMPNQQTKQGHWSARSKARKAFRAEAMWQAGLCLPHDWQPLTGPVALDIYVHWPKRRRPDLDAVVSSVKSAIDGLADAGIFADDRQIIEIRATHDYGAPAPGLTRFTITEKSA